MSCLTELCLEENGTQILVQWNIWGIGSNNASIISRMHLKNLPTTTYELSKNYIRAKFLILVQRRYALKYSSRFLISINLIFIVTGIECNTITLATYPLPMTELTTSTPEDSLKFNIHQITGWQVYLQLGRERSISPSKAFVCGSKWSSRFFLIWWSIGGTRE